MVYEVVTTMAGPEILRRAKDFFAERVPLNAAYPEREGPGYLTMRCQGGEEIAFAAWATPAGTHTARWGGTTQAPLLVDTWSTPWLG